MERKGSPKLPELVQIVFTATIHLCYTDETNIDPKTTDFFVYAGVAIDGATAVALSEDITKLRTELKFKPEDLLKFNTREKPEQLTIDDHKAAKKGAMDLAAKHGVHLFASMILHKLATSPDEARRNEINRLCSNFNSYLSEVKDSGLVLIDNFCDPELPKLIREKFALGLTGSLPFSETLPLKQILGYHLAAIGSSHFCSVVDIVLGGLRFAINNRNDLNKAAPVGEIMKQLAPLCHREPSGKVSKLSLFFSPMNIYGKTFHDEYIGLQQFFKDHQMECGQTISNKKL